MSVVGVGSVTCHRGFSYWILYYFDVEEISIKQKGNYLHNDTSHDSLRTYLFYDDTEENNHRVTLET